MTDPGMEQWMETREGDEAPRRIRATTILSVRRAGEVVVVGDGQVTLSERVVLKSSARKVRRIHGGRVICGFAGATADAITLFERLEERLGELNGNLKRAAVELAKEWRSDRALRRLEAMMIAADEEVTLLISGTGDVLEPEGGIIAIGSGGNFALSAARALARHTEMSAEQVARSAMEIASELCVFTNSTLTLEHLGAARTSAAEGGAP